MLRRQLNSEDRQRTVWRGLIERTAAVAGLVALGSIVGCLPSQVMAQAALPRSEPTTTDKPVPIVLRDLTLVRDDPIVSFDERGVVLDSQIRIGWSKILSAKVDVARQPEVDRYLNEVGLPLFRLESRLAKRDWAGIGEIAEPLYESLRAGSLFATEKLRFLVCRATMESRLYNLNDMEAIEPFLRAAAHQTRLDPDTEAELQRSLLPANDISQMVSDELLPIWFDAQGAASVYSQLNQSIESGDVARTPGALLYLASLAITAENDGLAGRLIDEIRTMDSEQNNGHDWMSVVDANRLLSSGETGQGRQIVNRLVPDSADVDNSSAARAIALYLAGAYPDQDSTETQLLNLLTVPAIWGDRYPRLSAAALYRAISISREKSNPKQARILANELLRRYPNTYHGRLAAIEK